MEERAGERRDAHAERVMKAGWKGPPLPDPLLPPREEREKPIHACDPTNNFGMHPLERHAGLGCGGAEEAGLVGGPCNSTKVMHSIVMRYAIARPKHHQTPTSR